ncbi:MAG: tannase/feruloyl esterase family alpha/beta hydrolase [Acetobacteraceae bacterium]|nr:tannase/feruloyl esterase family alpha/beta hydrolase [Acetobacteraceae bacterium]
MPAGTFTPPTLPGATTPPTPIPNLPAFCRVQITSSPTSDSSIGIEVWMPENWNGKYLQSGNGGFAGTVPYTSLATAIQRGYAAAGTDDGHADPVGTDASWALGHPQKIIDYGYRALKETTDKAKSVIEAFAGNAPQFSYFAGCSDGGREALMESQRYPNDFDGIVVGDPANNTIPLLTQFIWDMQALLASDASYIPPAKLPAITNAALAACDAADGVEDGVIGKPRQCHFNPSELLCTAGDNDSCLTEPQLAALLKIYHGPHNSEGQLINPGFLPGAEAYAGGWPVWITGPGPNADTIVQAAQYQFGLNFFRYFVFNDPNWDLQSFNFDTDVDKALAAPIAGQPLADVMQSVDPDLSAFRAHGGKLIQYHGTTDAAIPPGDSVEYYRSVLSFFRIYNRKNTVDEVGDFYRLFLVPGMQHCAGGPGANSFGQPFTAPLADSAHDVIKALEAWVEQGKAPDQITATKYTNDDPKQPALFSRPLCLYPALARWNGTGDASDAANWSCR